MSDRRTFCTIGFGEILQRLHCVNGKRIEQTDQFEIFYSGAESNVCALLARLGVQCAFITAVPRNQLGSAAKAHLRRHSIETNFVTESDGRLGTFYTEEGNGIRNGRIIYDRENSCFSLINEYTFNWDAIFENANWFHFSGITPAVSQAAANVCEQALSVATNKNIIISGDFNYRSLLWKYGKNPAEVMPALLEHCQVIVGDLDAAKIYFNIETDTNDSNEKKFKQCVQQLRKILPRMKSMGMSFRLMKNDVLHYHAALFHDDNYFMSQTYPLVQITDAIGSGDAFTAGLIYSLKQNLNGQQAIDFAVACGFLKQSIKGDVALISKDEIEMFIQNGPSGKILR